MPAAIGSAARTRCPSSGDGELAACRLERIAGLAGRSIIVGLERLAAILQCPESQTGLASRLRGGGEFAAQRQ